MRVRNVLFLGCLSLLSLSAHAETVSNLYQVLEPVSGQSAEQRTEATQRALQTLVLRLTGDPKAYASAGLAGVRKDPQQIISQYGYDAGPPESLQVDFDMASTDAALRGAGLPLWGSNRPSVLTWWLTDTVDGASLVGDGQAAAQPLRRAAQHRGLPLRLPLADLQEQLVGTAKNLEGSDAQPLREASERYGADALVAVHAREDGGKWQATWRLWQGEQKAQGKAEGAAPAELADNVMAAISQRMAERFAVKAGVSSDLVLLVEAMNLERYAQLGRLLEPFGARLQTVDGATATYQVSGSPEQLRAQLSLGKLRELPVQASPAAPAGAAAPATPATVPAPVTVPTPAPGLRFSW